MVGFGTVEDIPSDDGSAIEKLNAMKADNAKYAASDDAKKNAGGSSG